MQNVCSLDMEHNFQCFINVMHLLGSRKSLATAKATSIQRPYLINDGLALPANARNRNVERPFLRRVVETGTTTCVFRKRLILSPVMTIQGRVFCIS